MMKSGNNDPEELKRYRKIIGIQKDKTKDTRIHCLCFSMLFLSEIPIKNSTRFCSYFLRVSKLTEKNRN